MRNGGHVTHYRSERLWRCQPHYSYRRQRRSLGALAPKASVVELTTPYPARGATAPLGPMDTPDKRLAFEILEHASRSPIARLERVVARASIQMF